MARYPHFNLVVDPQAFAFETGTWFRGVSVNGSGRRWNVTVRFYDEEGNPFYAISQNEEIQVASYDLYQALTGKQAKTIWRKDRYTPKMSDR